jgi:hypothetical protein
MAAFGDPRLAYVVLEQRELDYGSRRSRTLECLLDVAGQPVTAFGHSEHGRPGQGDVLIYRWNPERFSRWVACPRKSPGTRSGNRR